MYVIELINVNNTVDILTDKATKNAVLVFKE